MNASPESDSTRNLVKLDAYVKRADRARISGQQGAVLWFTGLSGSGKSTVANAVELRLNQMGRMTYLLDGDNVRHGLCADLGFSPEARHENIRRVAHVAKLFWEANLITLVSFISPFRAERELARTLIGSDFYEVYIDASLEICESRDPKGLYHKARQGLIQDFTGISSPYEPPLAPQLTLSTGKVSLEICVEKVLVFLKNKGCLTS